MVFSVICIAVICTLLAEFGFLLLLRSSWYWRAFGTAMYNCIPCGIVMCISYHSSLLVSKLPIRGGLLCTEKPETAHSRTAPHRLGEIGTGPNRPIGAGNRTEPVTSVPVIGFSI